MLRNSIDALFVVTVDDTDTEPGRVLAPVLRIMESTVGKTERKARWVLLVRTPVFRDSIITKIFFFLALV